MTIEVSWFVANMIGLRALLNEIIRASEIIKSERFGPIGGQYRDFGQDIHDSAHQILEQINTTLDNVERSDGNDQLKREPNGTLPMITLRNELRGSHFLRAQLVAVVGFSEIMMGGMFGPIDEKYRTYAEQINT